MTFDWTISGAEKLRIAQERGIVLPEAIRKSCEALPSLLEGRADLGDTYFEFGLGYLEPVRCIFLQARGDTTIVEDRLAQLELYVGGKASSAVKKIVD